MSPPRHDVFAWQGKTLVDCDGEEIGTVEQIYLAPRTGQPEWALVMAPRRAVFVPLLGAKPAGEVIQTCYQHEVVEMAPAIRPCPEPSEAAEAALSRHYDLPSSSSPGYSGLRRVPLGPTPRAQRRAR